MLSVMLREYCVTMSDGSIRCISERDYKLIVSKMDGHRNLMNVHGDILRLKDIKSIVPKSNIDPIDYLIGNQVKSVRESLLLQKKLRQKKYPYKPPFESLEQVKLILQDIQNRKI